MSARVCECVCACVWVSVCMYVCVCMRARTFVLLHVQARYVRVRATVYARVCMPNHRRFKKYTACGSPGRREDKFGSLEDGRKGRRTKLPWANPRSQGGGGGGARPRGVGRGVCVWMGVSRWPLVRVNGKRVGAQVCLYAAGSRKCGRTRGHIAPCMRKREHTFSEFAQVSLNKQLPL